MAKGTHRSIFYKGNVPKGILDSGGFESRECRALTGFNDGSFIWKKGLGNHYHISTPETGIPMFSSTTNERTNERVVTRSYKTLMVSFRAARAFIYERVVDHAICERQLHGDCTRCPNRVMTYCGNLRGVVGYYQPAKGECKCLARGRQGNYAISLQDRHPSKRERERDKCRWEFGEPRPSQTHCSAGALCRPASVADDWLKKTMLPPEISPICWILAPTVPDWVETAKGGCTSQHSKFECWAIYITLSTYNDSIFEATA